MKIKLLHLLRAFRASLPRGVEETAEKHGSPGVGSWLGHKARPQNVFPTLLLSFLLLGTEYVFVE